nr:unnamed protein product [Callosobruchus analis]
MFQIQCQCCCKPQRSKTPPKRQINNNHTQTITGQKAEMVQTANCGCVCATQTQNLKQASKSTKKKRKLVVCCHCCCHCGKDDVKAGEDANVQANPDSWDNGGGGGRCCPCIKAADDYTAAAKASPVTNEPNASFDNDAENENVKGSNDYEVYQATIRQGKVNPVHLKQFKPWDAALYQQKAFPKYGAPSKNYPWVQRTTSDIMDKYYKLKISEEFSSPVTGKTYNLSPVEVVSLGGASIKSSLPEPIEVKEDIQYLEKLETSAKHDIPSRIMLNAMCDAILYNNVDADCPSILLSEFTYLDKDSRGGCAKNNCSSTHCADFPRDCSSNSTQTQVADDKSIRQHVEDTVKKLLQEKEERLGGSDNTFKKAFNQEEDKEENKDEDPDDKSTENLNNFGSKQHCCFRAHEEHPIVPRFYPTFTKTGLLPSICPYKRSASPTSNGQVKKSRPCLDGGDSIVQNVNDLLDKIDEIALRSQENDQKVQNVLHSIGNPDQIHVERTSGFHMNFETSLSGNIAICVANITEHRQDKSVSHRAFPIHKPSPLIECRLVYLQEHSRPVRTGGYGGTNPPPWMKILFFFFNYPW